MGKISWDDFEKIEIRIGTVLDVKDFLEAKKPSYKLKISFGKYGTKTSSAQIAHLYSKKELIGKQVVCVTNFEPKIVVGFKSEVLVMGPIDNNKCVTLLQPQKKVDDGLRIA
jgi:tRNA-binding protein